MRRFVLLSPTIRSRASLAIFDAPDGYEVTIAKPRRSLDQNKAFWSLMNDLAAEVPFAGRLRSAEDWRTLIISAWRKATKRSVEVVPGLEDEPVILGLSSRTLSKEEMSEVLEYANEFVATHRARRPV